VQPHFVVAPRATETESRSIALQEKEKV